MEENLEDKVEIEEPARPKAKNILKSIMSFYLNSTTYQPKEDDSDYTKSNEKYGDSGVM